MDRDPPSFAATWAAANFAPAKPGGGNPVRIAQDDIARAARERVAAYGPAAIHPMKQRTRAVRRRSGCDKVVELSKYFSD